MGVLRNKGALLVLLWTILPFSVYTFFIHDVKFDGPALSMVPFIIITVVSFLVFGCFSDSCLSRYNIIHWSLLALWLSLVSENICIIIKHCIVGNSTVLQWIEYLVCGVGIVGMSGAMTNTMQFGIDQLTDASSSDICSYISYLIK